MHHCMHVFALACVSASGYMMVPTVNQVLLRTEGMALHVAELQGFDDVGD